MTIITQYGVSTNALTMAGQTADGIATDLDHPSGNPDDLAFAAAVKTALDNLAIQLRLEMASNAVQAFTPNLVSAIFDTLADDADLGWDISSDYTNSAGTLELQNVDGIGYDAANYIKMPVGRFEFIGRHLLAVTLTELSGTVDVILNGTVIETLTSTGEHNVGFTVSNQASDQIQFRCNDVAVGESTQLADVYVVGVLDQLVDFVLQYLRDDARYARAVERGGLSIPTNMLIDATTGRAPRGVTEAPPIIVMSKYLSHASGGLFDVNTGYLTSSVPSTDLANAVDVTLAATSRIAHFSAENGLATLTYRMHTQRLVESVQLHVDDAGIGTQIDTVTVTVNGQDHVIDLAAIRPAGDAATWIHSFTIPGGAVLDNAITIDVTATAAASGSYALGFGVTFADTNADELTLMAGTAASVLDGDTLVNHSLSVPIGIPTAGMVADHRYTAALNFTDMSVEVNPTYPVHSDGVDQFSYPLAYQPSHTEYYGTTAVNSGALSGSAIDIHASKASVSGDNISVQHSFVEAMDVGLVRATLDSLTAADGVTIVLTKSDASTITYATSGGDYPLDIAAGLAGVGVEVVASIDESLSADVVSVTVTVTSAFGRVLNRIDLGLRTVWYNTVTKTWSDGKLRVLIGHVTKLSSSGRFVFDTAAVRGRKHIPMKGASSLSFFEAVTVPNPFFRTDIHVAVTDEFAELVVTPAFIKLVASKEGPISLTCTSA